MCSPITHTHSHFSNNTPIQQRDTHQSLNRRHRQVQHTEGIFGSSQDNFVLCKDNRISNRRGKRAAQDTPWTNNCIQHSAFIAVWRYCNTANVHSHFTYMQTSVNTNASNVLVVFIDWFNTFVVWVTYFWRTCDRHVLDARRNDRSQGVQWGGGVVDSRLCWCYS